MIKNKFAKLWAIWKERRIDGLLDLIAWNTPDWLFFYSHTILVTSENPGWGGCPQPDTVMRLATEGDVGLFEKVGMNPDTFRARLRAGDRSVIVLGDSEILTMIWGSTGRMFIKHCGVEFDTGANGCFYYGSYTSEKARNRGLFSTARQYLYRIYAREGRVRNWGAISANNPAWLKSVLKKNYSKMGEAFYIRLLAVNISYRKSWPFSARKLSVFFRTPPRGIKCV